MSYDPVLRRARRRALWAWWAYSLAVVGVICALVNLVAGHALWGLAWIAFTLGCTANAPRPDTTVPGGAGIGDHHR